TSGYTPLFSFSTLFEGTSRPFDPCTTWSVRVPLRDIQPGTYTMKIIAEDMDGDFSVIHEQEIVISQARTAEVLQ
ncbi:MAG TPA: hypothetical protein PK014_09905, partial [Thermoanaerobaculia bacterium]|nr:hypothetical protein [Thermoanaerobaculia bacterium]HUM30138.1 hypothetical protein [Thermoanaerobaculia bacterium]HXK68835.1 hypothetical protein [Thermoanaerobaculia bacterium]